METLFVVLSVLSLNERRGSSEEISGHFKGYTQFHCHSVADPYPNKIFLFLRCRECIGAKIIKIILLHEKFLQFDWLRAVVFQLNLKYLHVKITNLLLVVV